MYQHQTNLSLLRGMWCYYEQGREEPGERTRGVRTARDTLVCGGQLLKTTSLQL